MEIKKIISVLGDDKGSVVSAREIGKSGGEAVLIQKTITANGTFAAADDNADGYSSVTVDVQGGGTGNLEITLATNVNISEFTNLLPSRHKNDGFSAVAKNKPISGYYMASVSGPVTPASAYFALMRANDSGASVVTATTGQAWGTYTLQAGITYEVIFYAL